MPLADTRMSGVTPKPVQANIVPVRPKPVITSSHTISTSWREQISRIFGHQPSGGTMTPPTP